VRTRNSQWLLAFSCLSGDNFLRIDHGGTRMRAEIAGKSDVARRFYESVEIVRAWLD
jgi:hypothetical protein